VSTFTAEILKRLHQSQNDKKTLTTSLNVIDPKYIASLEEFVEKKYRELKRNGLNETTPATYGNLHRKIPFELTSYIYFFDHKKIYDNAVRSSGIPRASAIAGYVDFMRQYNLANLLFLKTINNGQELAELKRLFKNPNVMLDQAGVDLTYAGEMVKKPSFTLAMLAYIAFNIVFSVDANIKVAARCKALEIIKKDFDFAAIMSALREFNLSKGFEYSVDNDEYKDSHPDLMHNILKIVVIDGAVEPLSPDTVKELIEQHPKEAMQVMFDLLCRHSFSNVKKIDKAMLFETLTATLTQVNDASELMLGEGASFRNASCNQESLQEWDVATMKIPFMQHYVDITHLATVDVKSRSIILEYALQIYEIEAQIVSSKKLLIDDERDDPQGYFKALGMDPHTDPADFEKTLEMHYRVHSTLFNPEDLKDSKDMDDLNQAFTVLRCSETRADYLNGVTRRIETNGSEYHQNGHGNGFSPHRRV
jgi:hypothetical protein